ncbi:MAG: type II toxin-antitoxin system RelE/ParE family toxin [Deltaproteobacteria bacterium]|nr:type II toxin-antitoxin system RelE/ParE family toxin [Deltaproteobacteria bacterium]
MDKITRRSEQLAEQPLSGRKVPEYDAEDVCELIEKPYRIIYRIKADICHALPGYPASPANSLDQHWV